MHIILSDKDEGTTRLVVEFCKSGNEESFIIALSSYDEMKKKFEELGANYLSMSIERLGSLEVVKNLQKIRREIKKISPEKIIVWNQGYSHLLIFALQGYESILHIGCAPTVKKIRDYIFFYVNIVICGLLFSKLIFCSEYVKNSFSRMYPFFHKKWFVVYNCISNEFFIPSKKKLNFGLDGRVRFIMVGSLEDSKDHEVLFSAWSGLLSCSSMDLELIIVGDGSKRDYLESIVNDQPRLRITFLGRRENIIDILDECDCFIFAAKKGEGFGLVLVEAASRGLDIISSDNPATLELSEFIYNIRTYNTGDVDSLKKQLESYLSNFMRKEKIVSELHRFESKRMVNEYFNIS